MGKNRVLIGCLCALGSETFYGFGYMFTKIATDYARPLQFLGWRFVVAAAVMLACVALGIVKINLKGKSLKPLIIVALLCPGGYFICEIIGISNTTASESGVFLACIPVASLVMSSLILRKNPSKLQVIGILVTLIGVIITVVAVGVSSSLSIMGYTFLVIGVLSYALYSVYVDKASDYTGSEITFVMLMVGAIIYGSMALIDGIVHGNMTELVTLPFSSPILCLAVVFQAIGCSFLSFFMANKALATIGVNKTSSFIGVSTVVSILAGAVFLGEQFTMYQAAGAVVIVLGIYIANARSLF